MCAWLARALLRRVGGQHVPTFCHVSIIYPTVFVIKSSTFAIAATKKAVNEKKKHKKISDVDESPSEDEINDLSLKNGCPWRTCDGTPENHRIRCLHWKKIYDSFSFIVNWDSHEDCMTMLGHDPWERNELGQIVRPAPIPLTPGPKPPKAFWEMMKNGELEPPAEFCPWAFCKGDEFLHQHGCLPSMERYDVAHAWLWSREECWDFFGSDSWERDPTTGNMVKLIEDPQKVVLPPADWEFTPKPDEDPTYHFRVVPEIDEKNKTEGRLKRLEYLVEKRRQTVLKYNRIAKRRSMLKQQQDATAPPQDPSAPLQAPLQAPLLSPQDGSHEGSPVVDKNVSKSRRGSRKKKSAT